jgi:DNA helicase HerA-like ATPase
VLEEAHTFVRRAPSEEEGGFISPARLCREAFEKIAREGRKFGLGLVLSSQRPSELSATVLAQCNTFLLHRLVNDADQNLVSRLVPDNVAGLLKELPSLPSRQAILLGWATLIPVLVEMRELTESKRPRSEDPDFWKVWASESERSVDWKSIADEWVGGGLDEQ